MFEFLLNLLEQFYLAIHSLTDSFGLAIIFLSFCSSSLSIIFILIFRRAIEWNKELEQIVFREEKKITLAESDPSNRHLRTEALYAKYGYHPFLSVINILPLLIQLPFLILAFYFFKDLKILQDQGFLFIFDLSSPDRSLYNVNILPVMMTLFSIISIFFLKNFSIDTSIRSTGLALLFFLILYQQPSSLLLFWLCNVFFILVFSVCSYFSLPARGRMAISSNFEMIYVFLINKNVYRITILAIISFLLYGLFLGRFLNAELSFTVFKYFLLYSCLIMFVILVLHILKKFRILALDKSSNYLDFDPGELQLLDGILLLLPLAFLFQIAILNKETIGFIEIATYFLYLLPVIVLIPPIFALLLKRFVSSSLVFIFFVVTLTIIFALPYLSSIFSWYLSADKAVPFVLFSLLFGSIIYLRKLYKIKVYFLSILFFVGMIGGSFINIYSRESNSLKSELTYSRDDVFLKKQKMLFKPDIYLLTYDAYVGLETLEKYGIDNSDQEKFLVSNGFDIYPDIYSVANASLTTMSLVLEGSNRLKNDSFRKKTAGDARLVNILSGQGYKTFGILEPYFFLGEEIKYDTYFPKTYRKPNITLLQSLFSGAFHFDAFDERFGKIDYERWVNAKRSVLNSTETQPKFLYAHSPYPKHSQNSGKCLEDENEKYMKRLELANFEMREDIKTILKQKRESIIIVNGDHGPYLTGDCLNLKKFYSSKNQVTRLDLQDRFGTFLAIRWPQELQVNANKDEIVILQDSLRNVVSSLFPNSEGFKNKLPTRSLGILGSGPAIENGIIKIGVNSGEILFEGTKSSKRDK